MFSEIAESSTANKKISKSSPSLSKARTPPSPENITSTRLKEEHLEVAKLVLKDGLACILKPEEVCEITAHAIERVASDMIGLTTAVATALNCALNNYENDDMVLDKAIIKLWCEFYVLELLPRTKAMVESTTPTLDAYGLFLPSKMGTAVSEDLLKKGMDYELEKLGRKQELSDEEDHVGANDVNDESGEYAVGYIPAQDGSDATSGGKDSYEGNQAQETMDEGVSEYEYEYESEQYSDTEFESMQ